MFDGRSVILHILISNSQPSNSSNSNDYDLRKILEGEGGSEEERGGIGPDLSPFDSRHGFLTLPWGLTECIAPRPPEYLSCERVCLCGR